MKQRTIKTCLKVVVLGVVAILCQACSKGGPTAENYHWPDTSGNSSATNKSVWTADERMFSGRVRQQRLGRCVADFRLVPLWRVAVVHLFRLYCEQINKPLCLVLEGEQDQSYENRTAQFCGQTGRKNGRGAEIRKFFDRTAIRSILQEWKEASLFKRIRFFQHHTGTGYELDSFRIPELFNITESGEYTLRVQVRMGQMKFPKEIDAADYAARSHS